MADRSAIEWTDATWNPVRAKVWEIQNAGSGKERIGWHCEHVSDGCRNCYAETFNRRLGTGRDFKPGERYREDKVGYNNGEVKIFLDDVMLTQPLRWKKPRKIFVCSMTDLFADFVTDEMLFEIFAVMGACEEQGFGHEFQIVTKRAARMQQWVSTHGYRAWNNCRLGTEAWPARNVWLGVSAERQEEASERIPLLMQTPAAIRFISAEPLLGEINLKSLWHAESKLWFNALDGFSENCAGRNFIGKLNWVIAGGESGPHARPMYPDCARSLRDQCRAAGVPYFFKQWGEFLPVGQVLPGRGKVHGATAVKPGRMKLHYAGAPNQAPKYAFAERGVAFASTVDGRLTFRVGKKAAGRLLDGVEHSEFPAVSA